MCRICLPVSLLCLVIGCQTARPARSMKMGPPPPGYVKIVGEPVPNWQPVHLRAEVARAEPSLQWWSLGPRPILNEAWSGNDDASGRVVDIAIHPVDPDIAYVASASGGIWKTVDEGAAWTPLTDELPILNHGCVAIDPTNPETIYVGTGEYTTWTTGDGVFRSADGGSTWERIATTEQVGTQCSSLIVDPSDPQRIHLTGNDGYVRSDDGGSTWVNRLPDAASDLIMHPQDPSILYLGRHGQGVYRSTDGGGNWAKLSNGLPASGISRIILAIAPSNPNRLYAAINASNAQVKGMYRSSNGGNTWSRVNGYTFPGPQAWYDLAVIVDPEDEDTVYFGDTPLYRSTDGGVTRDYITTAPGGGTVHVDIHALTFGPDGALWVGCDGGMWKSTDRAATWTNLNATLNVTQFYNIALNPLDPAQVIGGTQDNGTAGRELDIEPWPQVTVDSAPSIITIHQLSTPRTCI